MWDVGRVGGHPGGRPGGGPPEASMGNRRAGPSQLLASSP